MYICIVNRNKLKKIKKLKNMANAKKQTSVVPTQPTQEIQPVDVNQNEGNPPIETQPDPEPSPETNEQILARLEQSAKDALKAQFDAVMSGNVERSEIDKLAMTAYKANDAVKQHLNKIESEKAQRELESKLNEHLSIVSNFEHAYDVNSAILGKLAQIPVGERTPEQINESNDANEAYTTLRNQLIDELKKSFNTKKSTVTHIPMGMSGKQLTSITTGDNGKKSKTDEIIELLDAGTVKTVEDIEALGYTNGTARSAIWKRNSRDKAKG